MALTTYNWVTGWSAIQFYDCDIYGQAPEDESFITIRCDIWLIRGPGWSRLGD